MYSSLRCEVVDNNPIFSTYPVPTPSTSIICPDSDVSISAEKCANIHPPITRSLSEKPGFQHIFQCLSTALICPFLWHGNEARQFVWNRDLFVYCCSWFFVTIFFLPYRISILVEHVDVWSFCLQQECYFLMTFVTKSTMVFGRQVFYNFGHTSIS